MKQWLWVVSKHWAKQFYWICHCRSFFQSVCVLGYCILPLDIALTACRLILITKQTAALFAVRFILVILGFAWSTFGKLDCCLHYVACVCHICMYNHCCPAHGIKPKAVRFSFHLYTPALSWYTMSLPLSLRSWAKTCAVLRCWLVCGQSSSSIAGICLGYRSLMLCVFNCYMYRM